MIALKCHRRQHLDTCLKAAQKQEDEVAEYQILAIIQWGKDQAFWCRLYFALGKHLHGRCVRTVQVKDCHGGMLDYETEEGVQETIFNEVHCKHYNLADNAPICKGALRD